MEGEIKAIWEILRDLQLTDDRKTRDDSQRGSQYCYLVSLSSEHLERAGGENDKLGIIEMLCLIAVSRFLSILRQIQITTVIC